MKTLKCLFAVHELWKYFLQCKNYENVHLKHMNYENRKIYVCNKNYEKVKIFVCNTGIMKYFFNTWIMKLRKCLFAIH